MDKLPRNHDDGVGEAHVIKKQYASDDKTLDSHVFGNIGLKQVDFRSTEILALMRVKHVETKKDAFLFALDKLRVMFETSYNTYDFQQLKMYGLNPDQLLVLL